MFLTPDEVADLTGYRQPAKQVEHLRRQRIPFHLNRAGHPKVARAILEGRAAAPAKPATWSPSWAANQPAT